MATPDKPVPDPEGTPKPRRRTPARKAATPPEAKPAPRRRAAAKPAAETTPEAKPAPRRRAPAKPAAKRTASVSRRSPMKGLQAAVKHVPLLGEPTSDLVVVHLTEEQANVNGLKARVKAPLEVLGTWAPSGRRPDPLELLQKQEAERVQWLLPLRHGRMASSAFAFYRGAATVMASDLASLPDTGIVAQLCGDAHLANFGVYGTPERRVIFDLNDFDETLAGPWEWDLKRLTASVILAGRHRGFKKKQQKAAARNAARVYREAMAQFADLPALEVYYASLDAEQVIAAARLQTTGKIANSAQKNLDKARSRTSQQVFSRLTQIVDGQRRIKTTPPTIYDFDDIPTGTTLLRSVKDAEYLLREYRKTLPADRRRLLERYSLVDAALKVVGVGSVGTRCFIALLEGRDEGDPLFLQVKEADESVLEPHLRKSRYRNHGERVVAGQRLMQAASDIFLGWMPGVGDRDFYWRQLRDWKGSADLENIVPEALSYYAGLCAWTLARAHARSGDPVEIAAYIGDDADFDEAMVGFAVAYADQSDADYALFLDAIKRGEIATQEG